MVYTDEATDYDPGMSSETLGQRIFMLRKLHMTQIELAKRMGVTQGIISGWENDKAEPDVKQTIKLATVLQVKTVDLVHGTNTDLGRFLNDVGYGTGVMSESSTPTGSPDDPTTHRDDVFIASKLYKLSRDLAQRSRTLADRAHELEELAHTLTRRQAAIIRRRPRNPRRNRTAG